MTNFLGFDGLKTILQTIKEYIDKKSYSEYTYAELKELKDNNKLNPGSQYRITDYEFTFNTDTYNNIRSAEHPFDIIVTADSENSFSDKARAIQHTGDTYFVNSDLAAWEVWYSFDNSEKYFWSNISGTGKGVIYRLIDEFGNDCPYDFKNILWQHMVLGGNDLSSWPWFYTFSNQGKIRNGYSGEDHDDSLTGNSYNNKISVYLNSGDIPLQYLTPVIFCNTCTNNILLNSFNLIIGEGCHGNRISNSGGFVLDNECCNYKITGIYLSDVFDPDGYVESANVKNIYGGDLTDAEFDLMKFYSVTVTMDSDLNLVSYYDGDVAAAAITEEQLTELLGEFGS